MPSTRSTPPTPNTISTDADIVDMLTGLLMSPELPGLVLMLGLLTMIAVVWYRDPLPRRPARDHTLVAYSAEATYRRARTAEFATRVHDGLQAHQAMARRAAERAAAELSAELELPGHHP